MKRVVAVLLIGAVLAALIGMVTSAIGPTSGRYEVLAEQLMNNGFLLALLGFIVALVTRLHSKLRKKSEKPRH